MKKQRLYTSCVLEKKVLPDGKKVWVWMDDAESGTEALKKVREFAENNPDRAFCACNMWPAVMTKAVTTFVYVDPEDPSKMLKDSDVAVEDDTEEEENGKLVSSTLPPPPSPPEPPPARVIVEGVKVVAQPKTYPKAEVKVEPKPEVKVEPKPETKPKTAEKPAEKSATKSPAKQEAFKDLFDGTGTEESSDTQEGTFANEDKIDPDENEEEGDGGVPKGLF